MQPTKNTDLLGPRIEEALNTQKWSQNKSVLPINYHSGRKKDSLPRIFYVEFSKVLLNLYIISIRRI